MSEAVWWLAYFAGSFIGLLVAFGLAYLALERGWLDRWLL